MRTGTIFVMMVFVFGTALLPAFAHNGETHTTKAEETAHSEETVEMKRLESLLGLLKQLVLLMDALKIQQGYAPVVTMPKAVVTDTHDDEHEMEMHHDEHSTEATTTAPVKELIIEVEPHNDKTHVHVRYVDKAEEMFFIDASLTDTEGIVDDVHERTGLSEDEITRALKFL